MRKLAIRCFPILVVLALGACAKNPVINIPPPPGPNFYTSDFGGNTINKWLTPLGPSSAPSLTLTAASLGVGQVNGIGADASSNFYMVNESTATIYKFTSTLTASSNISQATAIGPPPGVGCILRFGFDPGNNLWAADACSNKLYQWSPPSGTTPTFTITASVPAMSNPLQPVFDNAGHMFVANFLINSLYVFAFPTATSTPAVNANIATYGAPVDIAIDVQHRVFLSCASDPGDIQVFTPPWATGNVPAFVVPSPFDHTPLHPPISGQALRFDAAGNLYASYTAPVPTIAVFAPPLSAASVPLFTLSPFVATSEAFAH